MAEMRRRDAEFGRFVGGRARALRETHGFSVYELAHKAFLNPTDVEELEAGDPTSAAVMRRIAEVLDVKPHDLLNPDVAFEYHSVFISYGGPDHVVAERIHRILTKRGVASFFFPATAKPGQRLHRTMSDGVTKYDRTLLLCSRNSLQRPGVQNELEQVLIREAAEGGTEILIPVALDEFVFSEWAPARPDLAKQLRSRVIADLNGLTPRHRQWKKQIDRVLLALRKS